MTEKVYFSLGTNLGDRVANLQMAVDQLSFFCQVLRISGIYETPPWGYTDQPVFLNQVVEVHTRLEPVELLTAIKSLEVELGRQPNFRYGPRLIDIDILLYGSRIFKSASLTIPHAMLDQRTFVLVPLVELAPDLIHPVSGFSMQSLLSGLDSSEVKLIHPAHSGKEIR
jgi:2-amino-4-hydroxy-6-hydroxymethyldihydropteridine diphosphokinase